MKLNRKGEELYKIWQNNYYAENDKLGGDSASGQLVEGWCIIDNYDYIKTLTDECGLLIFGYDDNAVNVINEWIEEYGEDDVCFKDIDGKAYTFAEVKDELLKYFTED